MQLCQGETSDTSTNSWEKRASNAPTSQRKQSMRAFVMTDYGKVSEVVRLGDVRRLILALRFCAQFTRANGT